MHELEPFYNWRDNYIASEDKRSPFYSRRDYDEFSYRNTIYNYYIHPQWDFIGSPTLYIKILFADYHSGYAIIELIGEWNDAINNDIMYLKREIIDVLLKNGINKFILIGENVLNFHSSDDCYYEEWYDDIKDEDGWVVALNFREHIIEEIRSTKIHYYLHCSEKYSDLKWRKLEPEDLFSIIETNIFKFLA